MALQDPFLSEALDRAGSDVGGHCVAGVSLGCTASSAWGLGCRGGGLRPSGFRIEASGFRRVEGLGFRALGFG